MNEYISKEYIRNVVLKHWGDSVGAECYAYARVLDDIAAAPTIEVKRGRWIHRPDERRCPFCGYHYSHFGGKDYNYCPSCGAQMDGDNND